MEFKDTAKKVQELIAEGQTEEAIQALMEYTKLTDSPQHEDALLLSGQFRQWKRENMLGVEQSGSELRRIEMSILTILKGSAIAEKGATSVASTAHSAAPAGKQVSGDSSIKKMAPIIGGVLGLIAVILVVWSLMSNKSDSPTAKNEPVPAVNQSDKTITAQTDPATTPDKPVTPTPQTSPETDLVKTPTSTVNQPTTISSDSDEGTTILSAEETMTIGKKYYTKDRSFYVRFGSDGNLCVYRGNDGFFSGSYQTGKPLDGAIAKMQGDGNFVVYDAQNKAIWASETHPFFDQRFRSSDMKPTRLVLESDGTLALYSATNRKVWTLTKGKI